MDAAQLAAFAAALAALPTSAFLIIIIIILWKRLLAVTDLLIDARAAKTDDATKLVSASTPDAAAPAAPAAPAALPAPAAPIVFAQDGATPLPDQ